VKKPRTAQGKVMSSAAEKLGVNQLVSSGPQKLTAQPRLPSEARELLAPQAYKTLGCVRKARGGAFAVLA
jgi:hypothetical protein